MCDCQIEYGLLRSVKPLKPSTGRIPVSYQKGEAHAHLTALPPPKRSTILAVGAGLG